MHPPSDFGYSPSTVGWQHFNKATSRFVLVDWSMTIVAVYEHIEHMPPIAEFLVHRFFSIEIEACLRLQPVFWLPIISAPKLTRTKRNNYE